MYVYIHYIHHTNTIILNNDATTSFSIINSNSITFNEMFKPGELGQLWRIIIKTRVEIENKMKQNKISLQSSGGQSLYYAQLHYNICAHYLFMHQARLQVADFSARHLSIRDIKRLFLSEGLGTLQ